MTCIRMSVLRKQLLMFLVFVLAISIDLIEGIKVNREQLLGDEELLQLSGYASFNESAEAGKNVLEELRKFSDIVNNPFPEDPFVSSNRIYEALDDLLKPGIADSVFSVGNGLEKLASTNDSKVNKTLKGHQAQLMQGMEETFNRLDPGFKKLFNHTFQDRCFNELMVHKKRIYGAQETLNKLIQASTYSKNDSGGFVGRDHKTKMLRRLFKDKCKNGQCVESLEALIGSMNGKAGGLSGCDIPQILKDRGEFDVARQVHEVCNRDTLLAKGGQIINLINNAIVVTSAYHTMQKDFNFTKEAAEVLNDLYSKGYISAIERLREISESCLWTNQGKANLEMQTKELIKNYQHYGLQTTAQQIKDYAFRVHSDRFFDVNVYLKQNSSDGIGGAHLKVEQSGYDVVFFHVQRRPHERYVPAPVPHHKKVGGVDWVAGMLTFRETCENVKQTKMLVFYSYVKHCHNEFTPYASLLRAWYHQRNPAGRHCVMAIFTVGRYTPHVGIAGSRIQAVDFEKGNKKVRVVFNSDYCNDRSRNTLTDPFGNPWADDEWIKTLPEAEIPPDVQPQDNPAPQQQAAQQQREPQPQDKKPDEKKDDDKKNQQQPPAAQAPPPSFIKNEKQPKQQKKVQEKKEKKKADKIEKKQDKKKTTTKKIEKQVQKQKPQQNNAQQKNVSSISNNSTEKLNKNVSLSSNKTVNSSGNRSLNSSKNASANATSNTTSNSSKSIPVQFERKNLTHVDDLLNKVSKDIEKGRDLNEKIKNRDEEIKNRDDRQFEIITFDSKDEQQNPEKDESTFDAPKEEHKKAHHHKKKYLSESLETIAKARQESEEDQEGDDGDDFSVEESHEEFGAAV